MNNQVHTQIVSFIWSIADDCLRDVYVRGKYRDVILEKLKQPRKHPTPEKVEAIKDALKHFEVI